MAGRSFKEMPLLIFSAILAVTVSPLAILRVNEGMWAVALLDSCIVAVMLGLFLHVYLSRETRGAGVLMALIFVVGALASLLLQGVEQIYWAYPALSGTFFLLESRQAALFNALTFVAIGTMLWSSLNAIEVFTVSLTLLATTLFACSFALTAKRQQTLLQRLASVDPLTGAGNRRAQNEKLDAVNALYRRAQLTCSVLIQYPANREPLPLWRRGVYYHCRTLLTGRRREAS